MKIHSFLKYLRSIFIWLWDGKFYFLSSIIVFISILYLIEILNFQTKIVSAIFSISGLLIILTIQILDSRKYSYQNPKTIRNWIKSFPKRKPKIIHGGANIQLQSIGINAYGVVSIPDNSTIEEKVDFLLKQIGNIQTRLGIIDGHINGLGASLEKKSKEFEKDIDNLDSSLKSIIAGHIVGDYDINFFGIIIAICGTLIQIFCI